MILWRAGFRYLLRHPLQICFAVVGVALGVAVVVAIDLANSSADKAFRLSAEALTGRTTHTLVGGPNGVDENIYLKLRQEWGWRQSAPVIEGHGTIPAQRGITLKLVGVDPLSEGEFRSYSPRVGGSFDINRFLTKRGAGLMTKKTADNLGLRLDEELQVAVMGRQQTIHLVGFLEPRDQSTARALENLVIVDISSAQELFGVKRMLSRVDLIVPAGQPGQNELNRLRALLPSGVDILPANSRANTMAQMTRAFQINLRALSLLALVVGMFLIYNTMTFSVLQRRPLFGSLRTLGVTKSQIFLMVVTEAIAVGAAGTVLGVFLGVVLANGLLSIVTRTINDLYFLLNVQNLSVTPVSLLKGVLLGLGATSAAALIPAYEAAKTSPRTVLIRSTIETRQRVLLPWGTGIGVGLIILSIAGLFIPSKSISLSFLSMFVLITGYALLTPGLFVFLLRRMQPLAQSLFGILGKMAIRNLLGGLSRTGVATSALVIAVAATIGVGLMIQSFRTTVDQWLRSYLQADIYVTTISSNFGPGRAPIPEQVITDLESTLGVNNITRARHLSMETSQGPSDLFVAEIPKKSFESYWFKDGDPEEIYQEFTLRNAVIISEPYAYHHDLSRGDSIIIPTDSGKRSFQIAGVFSDYGSDRGRITINRPLYRKYWQDNQVDALGLYLDENQNADQLVNQLRMNFEGEQQLIFYSNRGLREASLATFDRTFAVTSVLRMLAILVAFVGVLNALMAMQIERSRELAVLRASGLTPQQLWRLVISETSLVGIAAGLLALPLGVIQALVLILVINQRSFGWSMQISLDAGILLQAIFLAFIAALLAGIFPAWRMSRTPPAAAMRYE
ncbi:MAG: ABC transporter permease [Desulfuromonas sp.]|nr:MAG: ABC transporter permease [Desulfuromonas sp.]